ncbi:uncharacterized protein LOC111618704 [Centruroides sculpturatus]|uniref:uncharacterized protein LOC111617037 n=1 Tax=Centruroides sculpturatus TaxID=218467 RepID=UPI000C6D9776|nr:uncharacterized protein LOC111617037 [Centruroides sculpturatus]XP_023216045.1 uncharacterized protein LOC111618704 [Centruroides sculpturatus]
MAYIKKFLLVLALLALILCTVEFIPGNARKLTTEAIVACIAFNYNNTLCNNFCIAANYTVGECTLRKHGQFRNVGEKEFVCVISFSSIQERRSAGSKIPFRNLNNVIAKKSD